MSIRFCNLDIILIRTLIFFTDPCVPNLYFTFCFAVDDGAIMDVIFENFSHGPPPGYDSIMVEKSLLEND